MQKKLLTPPVSMNLPSTQMTWWLKRPPQAGGVNRCQAHAAALAGSISETKSWMALASASQRLGGENVFSHPKKKKKKHTQREDNKQQ